MENEINLGPIKSNNIFILALLFEITFVACKSTQLISNKNLRFDGVYVYDNGKDTIIKDYEAFHALVNSGLAPQLNIKGPDTFAAAPGSRKIEYLKFLSDGRGLEHTTWSRDIDKSLETLDEFQKRNDPDQIFYYSVSNDTNISLNLGLATKNLSVRYTGVIRNDSLYLRLSYENLPNYIVFSEGDSIRSYKFLKAKR